MGPTLRALYRTANLCLPFKFWFSLLLQQSHYQDLFLISQQLALPTNFGNSIIAFPKRPFLPNHFGRLCSCETTGLIDKNLAVSRAFDVRKFSVETRTGSFHGSSHHCIQRFPASKSAGNFLLGRLGDQREHHHHNHQF